jgi:uncharacterized protein (DUF1330 family)
MDAQPQLTPSPSPSLVKGERIYELRTYHAAEGKLEALHARFRDHTMKIFTKHHMKVVGFYGPVDKEKGSEDTLIYILEFPSRDAMKAAWAAFRTDPEWTAVQKASEANGKLTTKVDSVVMKATDYEKIK